MNVGDVFEVEQYRVLHTNAAGEYASAEAMEMFVFEIDETNETALLTLTGDSKAELSEGAAYDFDALTVPLSEPESHRYVKRCERID